jgi:tRNA G18 (ribose-2'-O)-methylase SpoU
MPDMQRDIRVLLHDIRSAHNVGAIFRTSDAIGVSRIYLSGFSPSPLDRFGRPVKEIAKTALGAERLIPWEHIKDPIILLNDLSREGFQLVGIEQDPRSVDYRVHSPKYKSLILLGSEVEGLSNELRAICDAMVEIPMVGTKESLNVSVAFGIAMFAMFDKPAQ